MRSPLALFVLSLALAGALPAQQPAAPARPTRPLGTAAPARPPIKAGADTCSAANYAAAAELQLREHPDRAAELYRWACVSSRRSASTWRDCASPR